MALKPGFARAVGVPAGIAALVAWVVGAILAVFLEDGGPFVLGLVVGWTFYAVGRGLLFWDVPKGGGAALQAVATGAAGGIAAMGLLDALLDGGPGWPYTPWWALGLFLSIGVYRAHRPILKAAREKPAQGRLWGVFDRREVAALAVLVVGYAMAGLALHKLFSAFAPLIPSAGKALTLGIAAYALYGARLLLAFASHDEATPGGGFLAWCKANLLRNALVVVVLVAFAVYRADLARAIPHYPLVEFGLGIALFSLVLTRLRAHLRRGATSTSTTSEARDHRQKVETLTEADYETVAGAVARFVETGRGRREYMETVRSTAGLDESQAERVLAPVRAHWEPFPLPVLPYGAAAASYLVAAVALACATTAALVMLFVVPLDEASNVGLLLAGCALMGMQVEARRRLRPWLGLGYAGAGLAILLGTFFLRLLDPGDAATMPVEAWLILLAFSGVALGVPAYQGWRLDKGLRAGTHVVPPRARPSVEAADQIKAARRRIGITAGVALGVFVAVPPLARWAARLPVGMEGFPAFYADLCAVAAWVFPAVGIPAIIRFLALREAYPRVLAEERRRRDARLSIHTTVMSTLERV